MLFIFLQALSVLMVAQNTIELLIGLKALPKAAKVGLLLQEIRVYLQKTGV